MRLKRTGGFSVTKEYKLHNLSDSREYKIWSGIKQRCNNKKRKDYLKYGAKGIKICDRWLNSFPNFLEDMGRQPTNKHTIDRINNDGDYEPTNCRWATYTEQNYNQRLRKDNTSGCKGVSYRKDRNKWRAYYNGKALGYYDNIQEAINIRKKAEKRLWRLTTKLV